MRNQSGEPVICAKVVKLVNCSLTWEPTCRITSCVELMPGHFSISIRRDVCLLPASSCNRASSDQLHLVSRRHVAEARRVVTLRGTTVLLYAKHHETSDWSNLLHWLSACLYVAIATGLSVKANTTAVRGLPPVQGVLLPQVR